jgi:hypothetical protein
MREVIASLQSLQTHSSCSPTFELPFILVPSFSLVPSPSGLSSASVASLELFSS